MAQNRREATPVARLLGSDGKHVVGWVYLWENAELSILWVSANRDATAVDPPLLAETLAVAKACGCDAVASYLETLSSQSGKNVD